MGLLEDILTASIKNKSLLPRIKKSTNFKHWISIPDDRRCFICADSHGTIYDIKEIVQPEPPIHPYCRCEIVAMDSIKSGTATINGLDGVDWWLKHNNRLPDYYINYNKAKELGWIPKSGNFSELFPGKMITRGEYKNRNKHLPVKPGRIWHEADINYTIGFRGNCRILWSNDGLIFVTYDHYHTFYEII